MHRIIEKICLFLGEICKIIELPKSKKNYIIWQFALIKQESAGEYDETDIHRLIFAGDIPQDAFCERRMAKIRDLDGCCDNE